MADQFTGEARECNYLNLLKEMEWEGYWILALWKHKNQRNFKKLWQTYLKTQKKLITLFDSELHWRKGVPHKTQRTSKILPIEAEIDKTGYITWYWSS